jgi:hypothetical protein
MIQSNSNNVQYTKEVIDNIRKVVGDIFAAEIASATQEFIKMSREQGLSMKQATRDSFQVYKDSKEELDTILESQEQLIELYEKNEEIRKKVNEITPDSPLPSVKSEKIMASIEERVNFMNELIDMADHYVKTYTDDKGKKISIIKGQESIDKMIITRDLLTDGDELESEKFEYNKEFLDKLFEELKVFKELYKPIVEQIPEKVDDIVEPTPILPDKKDPIDDFPEPDEEPEPKKKRKKGKNTKEPPGTSLFEKFIETFMGWIDFDKKRNWVGDLIKWLKNEKKQDKLKEPDFADTAAENIVGKLENFSKNVFDDILGVPDFILGLLMNAKSALVDFTVGFVGFFLKKSLAFLIRTVVSKGFLFGSLFTIPVLLLMVEPVKKFAIDMIKNIFGENRITNIVTDLLNDNSLQMGAAGAIMGFSMGGPIGAIIGFLVASVGNYVYNHWDEILKTFSSSIYDSFTSEGLKKTYENTKNKVDELTEKIKKEQEKYQEIQNRLTNAYATKDAARIESLTAELLNIGDNIKTYQDEKQKAEDMKKRAELRLQVYERGNILDQVWLLMDWISFGFLSQWTLAIKDFREYLNKEFTYEKIREKLSNVFDDLINSITEGFQNYVKSMKDWLYQKLGIQTDEEKKQIENGDKKAIESLNKMGIQNEDYSNFSKMYSNSNNPIKSEIKMIDTKKLEEDIIKLNNAKMGGMYSGPVSTTVTNVNNTKTSISNRPSPIDPSRMNWMTGGGF